MIADAAFLAWLFLQVQVPGLAVHASGLTGQGAGLTAQGAGLTTQGAGLTAQGRAGSGPHAADGLRQEPPAPAQDSGGEAKFNPAIAVIPDVAYYNDNRDGEASDLVSDADGFARHAAGEGHVHGGGLERGFTLREVEVSFSGAVDPYFDAQAILAIGDGEVEAEEVYVQTRALAPGLQLRAGKFYSGIGYLNAKHPHQWDFVDRPLPYSHLLGGGINEAGLQVTWLPALPVYVLVGGELLQGTNDAFARQLGPSEADGFAEKAGPRLLTGFVKVSPNLGDSHTLQAGASVARSRLHQEFAEGDEGDEPIEGTGTMLGADLVYQYDSGRQWGVGDVTLQGEYFRRRQDLALVMGGAGAERDRTQDGFYLQGTYGFAARWKAGLRFDAAGLANEVRTGAGRLDLESVRRYTAALTFLPTEFSRLRVQYTRADSPVGGVREKASQLWVQLQISLGAHGAHVF